jgi:hypothetical protein
MTKKITAFALGTILALGSEVAFIAATHAQQEPRRVIIVTPSTPQPYWDSNIVPRYRYRPEDDRVDPCGGPVVPVIRYGSQEQTVPLWLANDLGLGRVHGRDWPCGGRSR